MTPAFLRAYGAVAALGLSMACVGADDGTATGTAPNTEQTVTVVGCIQSEADYRKARKLGRGGTAGTGVGVGNEFVLIDAKMTSTDTTVGAATGTTGAAAQTYKLTAANEGKASQFVGKRVEITGTFKPAENTGAAPTRRPTAGGPPRADVFEGEDLRLRELEVTSVRETAGTCPAT